VKKHQHFVRSKLKGIHNFVENKLKTKKELELV